MTSIATRLAEIERITPEGGDWCSIDKSGHLGAIVLALRPRTIVEIGVFLGGSLIPMALAQQRYASGAERTWAIDPWAADASIAGQNEANRSWWQKLDHDQIYERFLVRLRCHGLGDIVHVVRRPSDAVEPPPHIDLAHIDGNHGEQAHRDVQRFAPRISVGGILVLDDLDWQAGDGGGGGVRAGYEFAVGIGFVEMYKLGTGVVMQRRSVST